MDRAPLARLLTAATQAAVDRLNAELIDSGFPEARAAHGYALLALGPDGLTTSALAAALGITKQGTAKLATRLEAAGLIQRRPHEQDARATLLHRTAKAERLLAAAARVQEGIERDWGRRFGERRVRQMRAVLEAVVDDASPSALQRLW